jgi:hypothetical protein
MIKQEKKIVRISKNETTQQADMLIREYKQNRWAMNSDKIGKPDSLSAWYSISQLEDFIAEAKSNGGDGIKLYYGAYPAQYQEAPDYSGRQTLVMVATRTRKSESDLITNKDIYVRKNGRLEILSGLHPIVCPPSCGSAAEGGMGDLGITIVDRGEKGLELI